MSDNYLTDDISPQPQLPDAYVQAAIDSVGAELLSPDMSPDRNYRIAMGVITRARFNPSANPNFWLQEAVSEELGLVDLTDSAWDKVDAAGQLAITAVTEQINAWKGIN